MPGPADVCGGSTLKFSPIFAVGRLGSGRGPPFGESGCDFAAGDRVIAGTRFGRCCLSVTRTTPTL